jgi:pyrroline-5-carboxylate reductase
MDLKNKKVCIIGCGNLGKSILNGLVDDKDYPSKNIIATKRSLDAIKSYEEKGVRITTDNVWAVGESDVIIVAVKPYKVLSVMNGIKAHLNPEKHVVVSLATNVNLSQLQEVLPENLPVYRAMPNTAADVKQSVTSICHNSAGEDNLSIVMALFNRIGTTISINEELMEAATVLGACGTAFVLRFIRAMVQGGIQIGLDSKTASDMVNQTVKGAAELLIERKNHPEFEIDKVTTPKGCTILGLNEMEHNGFSSSLIKGIVTSFEKIS